MHIEHAAIVTRESEHGIIKRHYSEAASKRKDKEFFARSTRHFISCIGIGRQKGLNISMRGTLQDHDCQLGFF